MVHLMVLETSGLGDAGEGLTLIFDLAASWAHLLRSNFFSQLTRPLDVVVSSARMGPASRGIPRGHDTIRKLHTLQLALASIFSTIGPGPNGE